MKTIIQDEQAERDALACVLASLNGDAESRFAQLEASLFHDSRHQTIFRALLDLDADKLPLTVPELHQRLKVTDAVDRAGGVIYVTGLPEQIVSAENFPTFLQTIRDRAERRAQLAQLDEQRERLLDLSAPIAEQRSNWEQRLEAREFRFDAEPPAIVPVYSLCGNTVCTAGNLTSVVSQAKTGKSAVIGAMIAATMSDPGEKSDCLGFTSRNPNGRAVIHFDTEQSPADFWHVIAGAVKRADVFTPPDWLRSYCLTGLLPKDAWRAVQEGIRLAADRFPGVHSVLVDGVGDLVHDVNDAGECTDFVAALHGLAIEHDCPIVGVLHFNPDTAKARGHLGSQLERKSESNLRLDKEGDATVLWSNKQRRSAIARDFGPRFQWSTEAGMHVTIESRSEARLSAKAEAEIPYRDDVFHARSGMRYNELIQAIETTVKCAHRTAERKAANWSKLGIIEKSVAGIWIPKG